VGVTFSDEQKAQIQAMQEAGDMAGAQAVILAEQYKEFGGSAAAAAEATGGWSEFNGRMGEAKETLGAAVLPLLNTLAGVLVSDVMPVIEEVADAFAAWLADPATQEGIRQIADAITSGLGVAFDFLTQTAIPALMGAWALIQPAIASIIPFFTNDVPGALNVAGVTFTQLQSTVDTVMAGVMAVVSAVLPQITAFWQANGADIMATVNDAWTRINAIIQTALQLIAAIVGPALQAIAGFISSHGEQIQALLTNTWNAIKAAIDIALSLIQGIIKTALQIVQGDWSGAWTTIKETCARIVQDLWTIIQAGIGNIVTLFGGLATQVMDALAAFPGQAAQLGKDVVNGIIQGVESMAGALLDVLADLAADTLQSWKDAIFSASPSKVFAEEGGKPIVTGIIEGIQTTMPALLDVLDDVAASMIAKAKKVTEKVVDEANAMQDALIDQAEGIADKLGGVMSDALLGTASLDRAKAKAIGALKDISAAQQEEVQKQLAAAAQVAGGFGDPKQAAAYFKQRSDQIFELAKLRDQIEKTTDEAAKARLIEQYNLIGKAQQSELEAIATKGNTSPVAAIAAQIQKLLTSGGDNLPGILDPGGGIIGQLMQALPQLVAMSQSPVPAGVTQQNMSQFTYSPTVNASGGNILSIDYATAKALAMV
jgi:phage-related protein